ncbi:MAG: ABC transporter ATP-binding protein/permease [Spirochaetia bacterium]|jgi:ATP-binding cassette subfamily B protein|nr:ABC transporter ATP-binding protein/permease [Spirochaetia bacterium]
MQKQEKNGISRLLQFAGHQAPLVLVSMVFSAVSALLNLVPFVCVYLVVEQVLQSFSTGVLDTALLQTYGIYAVVAAGSGFLMYGFGLLFSHYAAFCTARNMRSQVMHHIVCLPMGFYTGTTSGRLRKIIDENTQQTETFLAHQIPDSIGAFITPVALMVLLLFFDWRLGIASLIPLLFGFVIFARMMKIESNTFLRKYQDSLEDMNREAVEYVRGISVVKVFGQTVRSFKSFHKAIMDYKDYVIAYTLSWQKPMTYFNVAVNATFYLLIPCGIIFARNGADLQAVLSLIFYLILTPACAGFLMKVMYMSSYKMMTAEAIARIDELLAERPLPEPKAPINPQGASVVFDHVSFSYPGTGKKVLSDVSFSVQEGCTLALVGPSGGGKTTIASLIPRFWDVDAGSVLVGGVDIKQVASETLMQQLSFVFQDSGLIKGSVADNIRLSRPNANLQEVIAAAHAAQCDELIMRLHDGLDTVIGEKGIYLSGGEQQRVILARAILKNAPIIILDEATAFADPENEYLIQKAFEKLTKGKTVIMIAHRLTTVRHADEILVVDDGKICEHGSHDQLVAAAGRYASMWQSYKKAADWNLKEEIHVDRRNA